MLHFSFTYIPTANTEKALCLLQYLLKVGTLSKKYKYTTGSNFFFFTISLMSRKLNEIHCSYYKPSVNGNDFNSDRLFLIFFSLGNEDALLQHY